VGCPLEALTSLVTPDYSCPFGQLPAEGYAEQLTGKILQVCDSVNFYLGCSLSPTSLRVLTPYFCLVRRGRRHLLEEPSRPRARPTRIRSVVRSSRKGVGRGDQGAEEGFGRVREAPVETSKTVRTLGKHTTKHPGQLRKNGQRHGGPREQPIRSPSSAKGCTFPRRPNLGLH
jgi:hypothetical protein